MGFARIVMRNHCRRQARADRAGTAGTGARRDFRLLFSDYWERMGVPSTRDGNMRRYGVRLDLFKARAYKFLSFWTPDGLAWKFIPPHRPWAGSRF